MTEVMDLALLAGRLLFGGFFLLNGINHLTRGGAMIGYARHKGIPLPALAVYGTGVLLLLGGASVLLGYQPRVGLALVGVFLLGTTPAMHAFWRESDPMARMGEQAHFLKNAGLLGAALALLTVPTPWALGVA